MNPLSFQIQICSNTAKGICHRVAGLPEVPMADDETTLEQLYTRINRTLEVLREAEGKKEAFEGKEGSEVVMKAGGKEWKFTGLGYLQEFALANFWFHMVTAYNILRKEGVPVGKMDYLGAL